MNIEKIRKGTDINTIDGFIRCRDYNGSIVYADKYIIDESGDETMEIGMMYTYSDIERMMHEYDGRNHKIRWDAD